MKLNLSLDLAPLKEEAELLAAEWAQRQVGNKAVRLSPIYEQKLRQAQLYQEGKPVEENSLLSQEATAREVSVDTLARAVLAAHKKEETRLRDIEMSRLEMKKIIQQGSVKDIQELISTLQTDKMRDLHQRRNQYRVVGGQLEKV